MGGRLSRRFSRLGHSSGCSSNEVRASPLSGCVQAVLVPSRLSFRRLRIREFARSKVQFPKCAQSLHAFSCSPQNISLAENQKHCYISETPPREEGRSANRHHT